MFNLFFPSSYTYICSIIKILFTVDYTYNEPKLCLTGVEALKLPEETTVRSAGHFLASFIVLSRDPNGGCLQPVVAHNSETLVRTLMFCICMYDVDGDPQTCTVIRCLL